MPDLDEVAETVNRLIAFLWVNRRKILVLLTLILIAIAVIIVIFKRGREGD